MRVNPRFFSSPASPARPSKAAADGFTLVELLVASAIGLVLTIGGVAMYFGNLRATTTLVTGQTLRDNWARVNLFINADISEACNAAVVDGALVLTLDPTPADPCGNPGNVTITYSVTGDSLVRTGPPIDANGVLNLGATAISAGPDQRCGLRSLLHSSPGTLLPAHPQPGNLLLLRHRRCRHRRPCPGAGILMPHPAAFRCGRHCPPRRAVAAAFLALPLLGCQPSPPRVSDQGREVCLQEAAARSGTASAAGRRFSECMKTIDSRLEQEKAQSLRQSQASSPAPAATDASPTSRYFHCISNRTAIRAANDRVSAALGPWMAASRSRTPDDPIYQQARARYEQAYAALEKEIPPSMRGGLPLIPDAARIFRRCDRTDFFPQPPSP